MISGSTDSVVVNNIKFYLAIRCACHLEMYDVVYRCTVISLETVVLKLEHNCACTLLLCGKITGNF